MPKMPELIAQELRRELEAYRGELTAETIDWSKLAKQKADDEDCAAYGYDVIGETKAQADTFEDSYSGFLVAFNALADHAAVRPDSERHGWHMRFLYIPNALSRRRRSKSRQRIY